MNLFLFEFKSNLKYTFIWSLALSLVASGFLFMYPSFSGDIDTAKTVIEKLPIGIRQALNVNLDSFFSLAGFYAYIFNFLLLAGSVMSLNLGLKLFSQEYSSKTADFLFSKPISRSKIFANKLLAGFVLLIIFNLVFNAFTFWVVFLLKDNYTNSVVFLLINVSLFIVQFIFFSLGTLIGLFANKIKTTISVAMPIVFAFFVVAALDSAINSVKLSELSPFNYFNRNYIIDNVSLENRYLLISFILVIILMVVGHKLYIRKDIKA